MAEVLGGIGESTDTTKFNGISNEKDETVPIIKQEEVALAVHLDAVQVHAGAHQLSVQNVASTQLSVQEVASTQLSIQSVAGTQPLSVQDVANTQLTMQDVVGTRLLVQLGTVKKPEEEEEEEEEDQNADQEDSSPSDYEFSLREENIRLKSRLEQAKEGMSTLEKQCKRVKEELDKEKKFGDKANNTIYSLMQEKQSLVEKAKRAQPLNSVHHTEGIQEVVRKLEHEIQVLEERLDSQRKRYHQEHLLMYEDLKEERVKRQEWKQTYLKSQVAVMAFRRKLSSMKGRVSDEDIKELSKCLELVFHEQDGHLKQDLITKKEEACVEGNSKYAAHISNIYKNSKEKTKVIEPTTEPTLTQLPSKVVKDLKDTSAVTVPTQGGVTLKHTFTEEEREDAVLPKVFIMDDENELIDPQTVVKTTNDDINVKLPPMGNSTSRVFNVSNQRYELDGNKHHHQSISSSTSKLQQQLTSTQRPSQDRSPQYKHWHHYSVENPGHNPGQNRKPDILVATDRIHDNGEAGGSSGSKKSLVNSLQRIEDRSYKSKFSKYGYNDQLELNVNDTKFLELNFDHAFLKGEFVSNKFPKLQQKNGIRNEVVEKTEKRLYCVTCDKEVPNKLCGHTNIIVQEKEKEFPCPTCSRVFTNRSHLKRHNMIHSGEKPFACTYCDKRFNRKSHLSRHLLTHTGEKPFKCPTCDKGFADNSDLKRHKQIHEITPGLVPILPKDNKIKIQPNPNPNPNPNPIAITAITAMTATPVPLQATITSVSVANKLTMPPKKKDLRYPCSKCGKTFSRKSHLTRHKLTHDKVKIYCDCGRLFRQNAHLQAHLPACIRKREAVEAKYLAECIPGSESVNDLLSQPVKTEDTANDSPSQLSVACRVATTSTIADGQNTGNNIVQSVDDFKARLAAKFNEVGHLNEIKSREVEMSKQSLHEKKIKEEILEESFMETNLNNIGEDNFGHLVTPNSERPSSNENFFDGNILNQNSTENSDYTATQMYEDSESLFVVTSIPSDIISNQYLHKSNMELMHKMGEQNLNEQKFNDGKYNEQKMQDINFNLIVNNGSSKLPNDDLSLGVDSLPCLPIEIPPLLNE